MSITKLCREWPGGVVVCAQFTDGSSGPVIYVQSLDVEDVETETFIGGDGAEVDPAAIDSWVPGECPPTECVKWSSVVVQLDNTGTSFTEQHTIELMNSDGSTSQFTAGPFAGWSQQITGWAAEMDALYPGSYDPRCTVLPNGCGGLLPPPSDAPAAPGIVARYVNGVHCPTDQAVPIGATVIDSDNPARIGRKLPFALIETPEKRGYRCLTCADGPGDLFFDDGTPVPEADLPVCVFACAETIPATPGTACDFVPMGEFCEIDPGDSSDPENPIPPTVVTTGVFLTQVICGPDVTVDAYTLDADGGAVAHELTPGFFYGDCGSLAPPEVPPPACPEGLTWTQVEIGGSYGILDNSNWEDAPTPHLQNGNNYEITLTHADGATSVVQQSSDPYFNSFIAEFNASMDGCTALPVCANHTSPNGCNAGHVANLANYPAYDTPTFPADNQNNLANPDVSELWASGWLLDCGDCSAPIVQAEITAATDPAWVGAFKDIISYEKPKTIAFQAVSCDGVFYKDCDGEDINPPACCPPPAAPAASESPLDCAATECVDPCVNGSTYINGRPPASNAWSWGPYTAPNLNDFEAALTAAGYTVARFGEKHQICPPFGAFGEDPDALLDNGIGDPGPVPVEPNIDPDFVAETVCAVQTVGCNDGNRDDLLAQILDELGCAKPVGDKMCYGEEAGGGETVEYTNDDNTTDLSASQNLTTIKWELQPGQEADADGITQAIVDCINSGEVAHITWTDTGGTTTTFDADTVVNPGPANFLFTGTATGSWAGKLNSASLVCGDGPAVSSGGMAQMWVSECVDGEPVVDWRDCVTLAALTAEQIGTLRGCGAGGCTEICPTCENDTVQVIACSDEDGDGFAVGDQILVVAVRDCDGVLQSSTGYNVSQGNTELPVVPQTTACDPSPEVEEVRECLVDTAGVQWTQLVIIQADGSQSDPIFINGETLAIGVPAGEPAKWTACPTTGGTHLIEGCVADGEGNPVEGFTVVDDNGDPLFPPKTKESIGFIECPDPVEALIGDGDECPCGDACAADYAACATTECRLLRVDADGTSFSQATLDGYRLQVEFAAGGNDSGCAPIDVGVGDSTGALVVVDAAGHPEVENFATAINNELAAYGFSASICAGASAGGTGGNDTILAITGPACPDTPWEIRFDSNGTGDEYALGWTGAEWYTREFVNGAELTNPTNDYNTLGFWDARTCTNC